MVTWSFFVSPYHLQQFLVLFKRRCVILCWLNITIPEFFKDSHISYRNLPIDQFVEDDFLCPVADVIYGSDPYQLIVCVQLLIDVLFLCHLCYKPIEFCSCLSVDVSKVTVSLPLRMRSL